MRDPNRIYEIIQLLARGWSETPDWRFGQLIENLKRYCGKNDLFYVEDDEMEQLLKDFFNLED